MNVSKKLKFYTTTNMMNNNIPQVRKYRPRMIIIYFSNIENWLHIVDPSATMKRLQFFRNSMFEFDKSSYTAYK